MPIFYCTHCGQPIDADETLTGLEVGCPGCYAVIRVPASAPSPIYQPYQPPLFAQALARSASHDGEDSSAPAEWRVSPVLGTMAAFLLCLLKKIGEPPTSLDVALGNTGLVSIIAGAIGYALAAGIVAVVIALIIAGIAAAFKKSFRTMLTRSYGIGVMLVSLLMLAGPALTPRNARTPSSQTNKNTHEELDKLQEDIHKMQSGVIPANDTSSSKTPTPVVGDASEMDITLRISRQYFEEVGALQKSYTAELNNIGFPRVLDAGRLVADTDFSESYAMLDRTRVLVNEHGSKMREALASLPARIRASNLNPRSRESYAQSAEKGTREALISFDENWALEASCIEQIKTIIDLLKDRRGHWQVSNNQFLFSEGSDLAAFNAALGKINEAVARQNEIKQKGVQNTEKVFSGLRSVLPK